MGILNAFWYIKLEIRKFLTLKFYKNSKYLKDHLLQYNISNGF